MIRAHIIGAEYTSGRRPDRITILCPFCGARHNHGIIRNNVVTVRRPPCTSEKYMIEDSLDVLRDYLAILA